MKIPYGKQNVTHEDIEAVVDVLNSEIITQGKKVTEFEKLFAEYVGAKYAVAVSSGTAALHLSNLVLGTGKEDVVLTTPISFVSTSNSVLFCGGDVDFVDIDPETFLIDIEQIEGKLKKNKGKKYSGIIPVDFAGMPIDVERLRNVARKYGLWILEDACHAPGGYFTDSSGLKQYCGNGRYSDLQVFSFHPVKHIAAGEGGMITTNDKYFYEKLLRLRSHGITKNPESMIEFQGGWYYEMHELGYNYRISDINCALAISQLKRAKEGIVKRNAIAEKYNEAFAKLNQIKVPHVPAGYQHAWHLFVVLVESRDELYNYLRDYSIFAQVHYIPIHLQPYYRKLGWKKGDLPVAENYYKNALSLPMYPTLSEEEQDYVIDKVCAFYKG